MEKIPILIVAVFKSAVTIFGQVDVMVNNAGIAHEKNWDKMIATNFVGFLWISFHTTRCRSYADMANNGSGRLTEDNFITSQEKN